MNSPSVPSPSGVQRVSLTTGEVVNGKYRIDRILGEGGMGVVVEAFHLGLEEKVALKFLHKEALANPEIVKRFEFEAKAASKLKGEHIGRVTDVDRREDGSLFIVMEYLQGRNLADELLKRGVLPVEEAVEYAIQACEALAEAHARGIVHRDIKPENLFIVARDGMKSAKLLDFGISMIAVEGAQALEKTSRAVLGSPYYMSPEQLRREEVDRRADLWSLGAVLFELLAGAPAFEETEDFQKLFKNITSEPHQKLGKFREGIPYDLVSVIDRCLEKDPDKRFQNAADLAIALLPFGHAKRSRVVAERTVALVRNSGLSTGDIISLAPPPKWRQSHGRACSST